MLLTGGILGLVHKGLSTAIQPAAADWRIGTLLAAGGSILLAAQSAESAWLVLPAGNACLLLGYTLYWRSVRRFDGVADTRWLFAPALCASLLLTWFVVVQPILWVRVMVASLGGLVVVLGCAFSLFAHRGAQMEVSRIILVAVIGVISSFAVIRMAYFSAYMRDVNSILAPDHLLNIFAPLSIAALPVIGTTAFLVMCLQRLRTELASRAVELDQKNEALRQAIAAREDAERIARHDLKTPLASIAATPGLLRAGRSPDAEQEVLLGMIENAARRALSMVNLSLDLYRMEQGRYDFRPHAVDLAAVTRTVMQDIEPHAASKQVRMQLSGGDSPVTVAGDDLLCFSCIANVLKNAVEAASDGSTVSLNLQGGAWVALSVHNNTAVPLALRERFFEKYATQNKAGGSGLGTYSSQLMARVQGGRLTMTTSDLDGTTLTLALKAASDALQAASSPGGYPVTAPMALHAGGDPTPAESSLKALVVDDDAYNCKVLGYQLAALSVEVDTALNGRCAVERCLVQRPDIIFMDIQMPVMDGLQALQRIRELQRARRQIPSTIVAFSSDDDPDSQTRFVSLGFDDSIAKPASPRVLDALLRRAHPLEQASQTPFQPARPMAALMPDMAAFMASRLELVDQLDRAATSRDDALVRSLAHKLNGSFAMYGFAWASDLCARLETNPERVSDAPAAVRSLIEHLRVVPVLAWTQADAAS